MMNDNGSSYVSDQFSTACHVLELRHIRIRPYTPRTNDKVELFIETLVREWASASPLRKGKYVDAVSRRVQA
jgi:transposase InsO family protein